MKVQTFIVKLQDADNITKDFYRFSFKRIETIKQHFSKVIKENPDFWYKNWWRDDITKVKIFSTPDLDTENLIQEYTLTDFYNKAIEGTL